MCALAVLGTLTSCDKDKNNVVPAPVAVDKTVIFEIFATKDYTASYNADHEARINLSISKTNNTTMVEIVVFDTTFTKVLKEFPLEANKLVITKKLSGVINQNEWIGIGSGSRVGAVAYGTYESLPEYELQKVIKVAL